MSSKKSVNFDTKTQKELNELVAFYKDAFAGFEFDLDANKKVEAGAQKKAQYTGMYKNNKTNQKYYIKKSQKYPADDIAEVFTSSLMNFLSVNAAKCNFVINKKGDLYIASECYEGFRPIISSKERGFSKGYRGSNPSSNKNKKAIYEKFTNDIQKQDLAKILAAALLVGDNDCHIGNLGFYNQKVKINGQEKIKKRVCKIDHGWGLADIFKEENRKINLFEMMSPVASRATHSLGGVPTNHIKDFPEIVNSHHFINALDLLLQKTKPEALKAEINKNLNNLINSNRGEIKRKKSLLLLAQHMALEVPKDKIKVVDIKNFMAEKMLNRLKERNISIALTKAMFNIKLRVDSHGKRMSALACIKELKSVIEKYLEKGDINNYMPVFKPESTTELLETLIQNARIEAKTKEDIKLVNFANAMKLGIKPELALEKESINEFAYIQKLIPNDRKAQIELSLKMIEQRKKPFIRKESQVKENNQNNAFLPQFKQTVKNEATKRTSTQIMNDLNQKLNLMKQDLQLNKMKREIDSIISRNLISAA